MTRPDRDQADDPERMAAAITTLLRIMTIRRQDTEEGDGRIDFAATELQTLRHLLDRPGALAVDIATFLGVRPTTAQSIIDRLVTRGLVEKQRSKTDRRALSLMLTDEGRRAISRVRDQDRENCRVMLAALESRRRAGFVRDLERIAAEVTRDADA
ncbi:MAG: MarR family winged helix-turn-helix transcriptional regulator [Pseudomonadota bacterium]